MNKGFLYSLSISIFFSLASCERDSDIAPIEEVVPLQVGNEWVYEVTDYDTNGKPLTKSSYKNTVQRDTIIHNSTWYILNNGQIVQNSRDGYVHFNKAGSEAVMIYQSTDYGGIGYMYKHHDYDLRVMTTRSQQLDTVTTASDTYPSYVFRIENQYKSQFDGTTHTLNQEDYVAPGVGLVRTDKHYADSDKVMQRHELVRYTLK
ncbi:hypothetical protein [Pontibacter pamirensis]|uniref:hypothetical protein n=1 Tax=Pontibacter pamirensis TaxID=2562824 RepID=UPI0013893C64|nr:hypothetical protein [Pontibacter pamirensis]